MNLKLLLVHCLPAAAVPIILAAATVASTGVAAYSAYAASNAPKPPAPPVVPPPKVSPVTSPKDIKTPEVSKPQVSQVLSERETIRDRRQKRTSNIFTSPLGAPITSTVKSLLGG